MTDGNSPQSHVSIAPLDADKLEGDLGHTGIAHAENVVLAHVFDH